LPAIFLLPLASDRARRKLQRRKLLVCLGLLVLVAFVMMSAGCGGGGFTNPSNAAQPSGVTSTTQAGSYIVQVTGTSSTGQTSFLASIPLQVSF
jgi:hypothetical protein